MAEEIFVRAIVLLAAVYAVYRLCMRPKCSCDKGSAPFCRDTLSGLLCDPGQGQKSSALSPKVAPFLSDGKLKYYSK